MTDGGSDQPGKEEKSTTKLLKANYLQLIS